MNDEDNGRINVRQDSTNAHLFQVVCREERTIDNDHTNQSRTDTGTVIIIIVFIINYHCLITTAFFPLY